MGDGTESPPLEEFPGFKHFLYRGQGLGVALLRNYPPILVFYLATAFRQLPEQHSQGLEKVERFKSGDHHRFTVVSGNEFIGPPADDHAHVSRPQKAGERKIRGFQEGPKGGQDGNMVAEQREIPKTFPLGLQDGQGSGRHGSLETYTEKDHFSSRVGAGDLQRIQR
jgi:hypothetical protein